MHVKNASRVIEGDAFRLQKTPLPERVFCGKTGKASVLSDDPVPGDVSGTDMESPADLPCHARIARKKGRLSVTYDLSGRDRADDIIDALKEVLRAAAVRPFRGCLASGGPGSGIP